MSQLVEKVAKALCVEYENDSVVNWNNAKDFYMKLAKIAIEAMKEPTHEMIMEGDANSNEAVSVIYTSMIEAALKE